MKPTSKQFPMTLRFVLNLFLLIFLAIPTVAESLLSQHQFERVLEDTPAKLVLEISNPDFNLVRVDEAGTFQVTCNGCSRTGIPGSPDLPVYRFDVITGTSAPQVKINILETETRTVMGGISPYPNFLSPTKMEYHADVRLFREAANLEPRLLNVRALRGVPIRGIETPLTLWSESGKTLTLIKRMQVEVQFAGVLGQRATNRLSEAFASAVKNSIGGAYLYRSDSPVALRKSSAAHFELGNRFIRFKIGDRNLENLDEDRVYGVSFSDLVRVSTDLNGVSIANLRMYTGPNDSLPSTMHAQILAGTLREIPIEILDKNGNTTFDEGDSVRFFAHGTSLWTRLPGNRGPIRYEFTSDPYSFENYYFLDFSESGKSDPALRLSVSPSLPIVAPAKTSSYSYLRAEKDLQTATCDITGHKDEETGFDWFWHWNGNLCGSTTLMSLSKLQLASEETDSLPDLDQSIPGDSLYVGLYFAQLRQDSGSTVFFGGKGESLDILRVPVQDTSVHPTPNYSPGNYYVWTKPVKDAPVFQLDSLKWSRDRRFEGYTVSYRRKHIFSGKPLWIYPTEFGKAVSYKVAGGEGVQCLRIEDGVAVRRMVLNGQETFTDSLSKGADAKYFLYKNSAALPLANIELQSLPSTGTSLRNLETGDGENPEYIIITASPLLQQAMALKDYRNKASRSLHVRTSVVRVEDIYRQFSSGRMSPIAIRDFLRWAYAGWGAKSSDSRALKYVLLFGDGNYDYRNIRASVMKSAPPNLIPPFECFPYDNDEIATDDFYAALDSTENDLLNIGLDVSVGRLPLQSTDQAEAYLQKVKDYEDPNKAGEWRSRVILTADDATQRGTDDGYDPITGGHTTDSDRLGRESINANEPAVSVDKIYLLDYPLNTSYHKPEATEDLLSLINRGTLMVNYVGHGASNQWADEALLLTNDALSRMHNEGRTPMINAFSCTVGRFESLTGEGMSEQFVKQKGVGAIAAVSSTRESFPGPNLALAGAFYRRAFPPDSAREGQTIGQALQFAKNSSETFAQGGDRNDLKYALLGEPVLMLRKPKLGVTIIQAPDTLKALDCSAITGKISGGSGAGFVNIKIVAGSIHKTYVIGHNMTAQDVDKRGNILFERTIPYKDFTFSSDYFIPKQISFGDSTAQILFFAWDAKEEREGMAVKQNLHIKGTATSACATDTDGKGPRIQITGCQKKETDAIDFPDRVKLPIPYCLQVQVQDSTGGVLTGQGPDEGTTLEIPGILEPYHPQPGIDDLYYKTYQLSLDKKTFRPGQHLLKVSARDGYGNISVRQMVMDLTADSSLQTVSAYNVPNPMKRNGTTFYFSTIIPTGDVDFADLSNAVDRVEFEIHVFNQSGKMVKAFQHALSGEIRWDGHDEWGQLLANGVYFYKITASQSLASLAGARPSYRTLSSKRNVLIISR